MGRRLGSGCARRSRTSMIAAKSARNASQTSAALIMLGLGLQEADELVQSVFLAEPCGEACHGLVAPPNGQQWLAEQSALTGGKREGAMHLEEENDRSVQMALREPTHDSDQQRVARSVAPHSDGSIT